MSSSRPSARHKQRARRQKPDIGQGAGLAENMTAGAQASMRNKLLAIVFRVANRVPDVTFTRRLTMRTYRPGERSLKRLERAIRSAKAKPQLRYEVGGKGDVRGTQ